MTNSTVFKQILSFLLNVIGYTFVLYITDYLFNSLYVEQLFYDFVAALIICILNKTMEEKMYKLIALDLDGTLLNSYGEISNTNKADIKRNKTAA